MQFAGGKSRSTRGMIALRAIVCFANADERCSSLRILGTNAICRRQITIRDCVIRTGNIALAADSFRFAEPGAWIRAPTYADANEDTGSRHSYGHIALAGDSFRFAEPGAWIRAPTRNGCDRAKNAQKNPQSPLTLRFAHDIITLRSA